MKVIIYGATGMVGQGALRECLADPRVTQVLAVGRTPLDKRHPGPLSKGFVMDDQRLKKPGGWDYRCTSTWAIFS